MANQGRVGRFSLPTLPRVVWGGFLCPHFPGSCGAVSLPTLPRVVWGFALNGTRFRDSQDLPKQREMPMGYLQDVFAILLWPFKFAYWTAFLLFRAAIWLAKGTFNLIVGIGLPALRFLAFVFILIATIAFVADATPAFDGFGPYTPTLFVEHWMALAPKSVAAAEAAVSDATHPLVWKYTIGLFISVPTYLLFGALGVLAALIGQRREKLDVFIN